MVIYYLCGIHGRLLLFLLEKTTGSGARMIFLNISTGCWHYQHPSLSYAQKVLFVGPYNVLVFIYVANCISWELHVSKVGPGIQVPVQDLQSGPGLPLGPDLFLPS